VILLVSHAGDDHLAPVRTELDRIGGEAVVVDVKPGFAKRMLARSGSAR